MAGKGDGQGEKSAEKLANQIACIKYTVFCFNVVAWVSFSMNYLLLKNKQNYFTYELISFSK